MNDFLHCIIYSHYKIHIKVDLFLKYIYKYKYFLALKSLRY